MTSLELVTESKSKGKKTIHIEGEINSKNKSKSVTKIVATITLPIKLNAHENVMGPGQGHTVAKHVGKNDNFLQNRLINEPQIPAAASFFNPAQAEAVINDEKRRVGGYLPVSCGILV
jgi:hypothetical protein